MWRSIAVTETRFALINLGKLRKIGLTSSRQIRISTKYTERNYGEYCRVPARTKCQASAVRLQQHSRKRNASGHGVLIGTQRNDCKVLFTFNNSDKSVFYLL